MNALLPFAGVVAGFIVGFVFLSLFRIPPAWTTSFADYISLATLAGLDTALGGVRAGIEGRFQNDIFVSGFILNTLLAVALAWVGDLIGVDLFLAAVVAIGTRVFLNLSLIRRYYLTKAALNKRKDPTL